MDDNNELIIYVLQQLRYGVTEESVRQTLSQNGWPQPLIDRAFTMVQQAAPHVIPPNSYDQQPQTQTNTVHLPVEAALPTPAVNPFPAIERKQRNEKRSTIMRRVLLILLALILLTAACVGGYMLYKAVKQHNRDTKPTSSNTIRDKSMDQQRKDSISTLSRELSAYYTAKNTYPSLAQINSRDFPAKESGFNVSKYKDPKWNAEQTKACTNADGQPIFSDNRSEHCFSYRVTARSGADCDGVGIKCTRVVLTANLDDNKPYIVALDQNNKE